MSQTTKNQKPSIAVWLLRCIVAIAMTSAFPLGATLAAHVLGWFSPAPDFDLFPTCVALSLLAGAALAHNMGVLKREPEVGHSAH